MAPLDHPTGKLLPQSLLLQRYLIINCVGRGGMGAVYQALDMQAGHRVVAIKEMSKGGLSEDNRTEAEMRFQQEGALLRSLAHPNLPRFHHAFNEAERAYLVMDFIQGKTLHQHLKEAGGRPLPIQHVLHYARQLCEVLLYLHQHQPPIIFRDLKPENIMVTNQEKVVLIDFGIARFFKEGKPQDTIFLGSPGYAAPEQHGIAQTTARSDLYSLGVTLYHCLTGRGPSAAQPRFAYASLRQMNADVPPELATLIRRLLEPDPKQRPQSAAEVLQVLAQILQQSSAKTEAFTAVVGAPFPGAVPQAPAQAPLAVPPPQAPPPAGQTFALPTLPVGTALLPPPVPAPPPPLRSIPQTPTAPLWDAGFTLLFGLLLLLLAGGSTLAFNLVVASDHWVEAALALFLIPLNCIACLLIRKLWPCLLLALTALTALLPAGAFLLQAIGPKVQGGMFNFLQESTTGGFASDAAINKVMTAGVMVVCLTMMLWLLRSFRLADRLMLLAVFGLALVGAFVQYPLHDDSVSKHILLVMSLISVNQGVLLATRIERLRS